MNRFVGCLLLLSTSLSGCATSAISNWTDPTKRHFVEDGIGVSVVKGDGFYAAWFSPDAVIALNPPILKMKAAEIKAIEKYSGCKVTDAEFDTGSLQPGYLQAFVDCTKAP